MQFLAVAVRFLTDFLFWQPVAVAVGPNMVKKPDPTGLSNTSGSYNPETINPIGWTREMPMDLIPYARESLAKVDERETSRGGGFRR
jgi:hypothetical protein